MRVPSRLRPEVDLSRRDRTVVYYLVALVALITLYTLLYNYGMRTFEGRNHRLARSFQTVVETMTTTGYGADSPWDSTVMNAFVVFMQLSGIGIGFFTLRLIIIPLFTGAEIDLDDRLTPKRDHLVVCEYRRDSAVLLDELAGLDVEYVLLSSSMEDARALANEGYAAINGSPQDHADLERASIGTARAVLTDAGDANVDTILTVRSLRRDVEVVALTDDSDQRDVLTEAGADSVLSPHRILGHRLAEKAIASFGTVLADTVDLSDDIALREVPISHGSPLIGTRIRNAGIRERTGASVLGAWIDGELQLPPEPDATIRANTVLLVSGGQADISDLSEFARPPRSLIRHERIVVAGLGQVGQAARSVVAGAGIETVTLDDDEGPGVDVVGDASSRAALREAGVEDAGAVIVCLPDDSDALLTAVLARSMNPDIEVLVRVNEAATSAKALSAGADYVLSVPRVSARMVARELRGEDVLAPASQARILRVPATPFAGTTLAGSEIYERSGCRVIAVADDDGLSDTVDPSRQFTGEEHLVLVGTDEAVARFRSQFDVSPVGDA